MWYFDELEKQNPANIERGLSHIYLVAAKIGHILLYEPVRVQRTRVNVTLV